MAIVTLCDIHKSFGSEIVFDKLNLQLYQGEKVGMVGVNGSGKSTILKLITSQIAPDKGEVIKQKGLRIGYLAQEASFDKGRTVIEEMHAELEGVFGLHDKIHKVSKEMEELEGAALKRKMREYDRLLHKFELEGGYEYEIRIKVVLTGLGFEQNQFGDKVSSLSGGQLSRLGLAKVLMQESKLLLLDEPTNHLDLQATEWLEKFLSSYKGAEVVISHDRYLLDRIAEKIIEVGDRQAKVWKGNYSNYLASKQVFEIERQRQYKQRAQMVERTVDFIARNKDQEGMRGTARGRKKRLKRLLKENPDFLEKPREQKTISFSFSKSQSRSELVLRCEGLSKCFGDKKLFEALSFDILRGERFGITGPNGSGKTSFLKLAIGELEPSGGTMRIGKNLSIGYLDQHSLTLDANRTVLEEALSAGPKLSAERVRSILGTFLFCGDEVFKKCGELSGGQQSRLMLCKLVLSEPDVLVLDEPTNHLDIRAREILEQGLAEYGGTIIAVSHDRFFLDRIAEKLLVMGVDEYGGRQMGRVEFFSSRPVYSKYASIILHRREQLKREKLAGADAKKRRQVTSGKKKSMQTAEVLKRFNRYSVEQIEQMIMELEQEIAEMKERFGEGEIYKNVQLLQRLQKDYEQKNAELELLYRVYENRNG